MCVEQQNRDFLEKYKFRLLKKFSTPGQSGLFTCSCAQIMNQSRRHNKEYCWGNTRVKISETSGIKNSQLLIYFSGHKSVIVQQWLLHLLDSYYVLVSVLYQYFSHLILPSKSLQRILLFHSIDQEMRLETFRGISLKS